MKLSTLGGAAAFALLLAGCGGDGGNASSADLKKPLAQIPAPQGDWTQVVSATPEGGFRMGNPDAPVKLVEFASLTCPHCKDFEEEGVPTLRDKYVKSGQVSWEFRTYTLFATDPGISMLLHCQGATPFFRLTQELYANQADWSAKAQSVSQEQLQQMEPAQASAYLVQATGLDQFFRQRGMPEAKLRACLADRAGLEKIAGIKTAAEKEGVTGTPTFFINGKLVPQSSTWALLEPKLMGAIK